MSNYKISETHREIIEQAAAKSAGRVKLEYSGDDFLHVICKKTGRIISTTFIAEKEYSDTQTSKAGLIELIGTLMMYSSLCMEEFDKEKGE